MSLPILISKMLHLQKLGQNNSGFTRILALLEWIDSIPADIR